MKSEWINRWNQWIKATPTKGIYERRDGGFLVRIRVTDESNGRAREVRKALPTATMGEAMDWLESRRDAARSGASALGKPTMRFSEYAASLFERKVAAGDIRSAAGKNKWVYVLGHLISGTDGVEGFGEVYLDKLSVAHVERWRAGVGRLISAGKYSPNTANTWLGVLKVVTTQAKRELGLRANPTEGLRAFDTSEHETYPEEAPNALLPEQVSLFLNGTFERWPQHYAMIYLGLITGLRPSSLRPLRRKGAEPDVLWEQSRLLVRRSHTISDDVMRTTKQRRRYGIDLPKEAFEVLQWHVDTQLGTHEQRESDLLFPAEDGGYRSTTVLRKPFIDMSTVMGTELTPRSLRRTFQDLARAAQVGDLVTRSISGHATAAMQQRYSTVASEEQREALAKVISLASRRPNGTHRGTPSVENGTHTGLAACKSP